MAPTYASILHAFCGPSQICCGAFNKEQCLIEPRATFTCVRILFVDAVDAKNSIIVAISRGVIEARPRRITVSRCLESSPGYGTDLQHPCNQALISRHRGVELDNRRTHGSIRSSVLSARAMEALRRLAGHNDLHEHLFPRDAGSYFGLRGFARLDGSKIVGDHEQVLRFISSAL